MTEPDDLAIAPVWVASQRRRDDNHPVIEVYDRNGRTIAEIRPGNGLTGEQTAHHARLIASAPNLLAELRRRQQLSHDRQTARVLDLVNRIRG